MAIFSSVALLLAARLAVAAPAPTLELSKRQDASGTIDACKDSACSDCPLYFDTGSGYPECTYYGVQQLKNQGYPIDDNGFVDVYFSSPTLDPGCQVLIQTPVTGDLNGGCGGNVLVIQGATCAPVKLDSTFLIQFCCGTGDCGKAGAPTKRSPNPASEVLGKRGFETLLLHYANGTVIPPSTFAPALVEERSIKKRDCGGFTATNGPYTKAVENIIISNEVSCGPTEGCSATESKTVERSFSVDVGVSVSDPFDIISASIDVTWEKSISRSFSAQYMFGPGETGYVEFIPILTCVDGYFTGDCDDSGKQITACSPSNEGGAMREDIRRVVVRGSGA